MRASTRFRPVAFVLIALCALLALPGGALAGKPTKTVIPNPPDFVAGGCGFPVNLHFEGKTIHIEFTDKSGAFDRFIEAYPGVRVVLTNPANGKQVVAHNPGPAFFDSNPDGTATFVGTGPWLWTEFHPATGEPGIWLTKGRFVFALDADGNVTSFRIVGAAKNLCPQLAG
jgi:hypothetical protein